ncbi:MAG: PH domain-containing protein [Candidatus Latescibacteria bacterium]|nr:PH domain-containing protein [Candidatus Latescibacterota bacterium]
MNEHTKKASIWVYQGIWRVLSGLFRVPEYPPTLPVAENEFIRRFQPSGRFLSYLKLYFWGAVFALGLVLGGGWGVLYVLAGEVALWLAGPVLLLYLLPCMTAYIAIHLRYDTMWYVVTDRSLRSRRGIWIILEHTITFENVQNVYVRRGPVQYFFGISTVIVETAGAEVGEGHTAGNKAKIEGVDNPDEIRRLIMEGVIKSKSAGLGDEAAPVPVGWSEAHVQALREILAEVRAL